MIKICRSCHTKFDGRRDAKTCSVKCRKRLQRTRALLKTEAEAFKQSFLEAERTVEDVVESIKQDLGLEELQPAAVRIENSPEISDESLKASQQWGTQPELADLASIPADSGSYPKYQFPPAPSYGEGTGVEKASRPQKHRPHFGLAIFNLRKLTLRHLRRLTVAACSLSLVAIAAIAWLGNNMENNLSGLLAQQQVTNVNITALNLKLGQLSDRVASLQLASGTNTNQTNNLGASDASGLTTGTLSDKRLSSSVTLQGNSFNGPNQLVQLNSSGALPILSAANLTNLNATNISAGTLADARLSGNVALLGANQTFSGNNTFTGSFLSQNTTNSTTAFQIQNAAGTSNLLVADTTNSRIAINQPSAGYTLDVNGDINSSTGIRVAGSLMCTSSGCAPAASSGNYIQNGTTLQTANFAIQSAASSSIAALIRGASGQTADLLDLVAGDTGANMVSISASGAALFKNSVNSTSAFQIQNQAGNNYLLVNTSGASVSLGNTGIASTVQIGNTTGAVAQTINIGNNATAGSTSTLTMGNLLGSSSTLIQGGTGTNAILLQTGNDGTATIGTNQADLPVITQRYAQSFPTVNATFTTFNPTSTVQSGTMAIVAAGTGGGFTVTSVTDSKGNSWSVDKSGSDGTRISTIASAQIAVPITPSDTITVTYSGTNTNTAEIWVEEMTKMVAVNALDKTASGSGTGQTQTTSATATLSQNVELAWEITRGSLFGQTFTPGAGWTGASTTSLGGLSGLAYKLTSTTAGVSGIMTNTPNSINWSMAVATYKATTATVDISFLNVNSLSTFKPNFDSATTFQVQNSAGTNYIHVNTSGATLSLGNTSIASTIQIGNTTGAVAQTINIGNNATASSTNTLTIGNLLSTSATTIQGGTGASAIAISQGAGGTITIGNTSGTSPLVFQAGSTGITLKSTSSTAFVVQKADGTGTIFSVDTSAGAVTLGKASSLNGQIIFANSTNNNTVTLVSGATSSSYSLTLPTSTPVINQCLEAGSSTATSLRFGACINIFPFISGTYVASGIESGNMTPTLNRLVYTPIYVAASATFDSVSTNLTTPTAAGGVFRVGLYNDSGNGYPSSLVADFGTVAMDGSAGTKTITISQAVTPGLYWIASVGQVAVSSTELSAFPTPFFGHLIPSPASGVTASGKAWFESSVSGSLPANAFGGSAPTVGNITSTVPPYWQFLVH